MSAISNVGVGFVCIYRASQGGELGVGYIVVVDVVDMKSVGFVVYGSFCYASGGNDNYGVNSGVEASAIGNEGDEASSLGVGVGGEVRCVGMSVSLD